MMTEPVSVIFKNRLETIKSSNICFYPLSQTNHNIKCDKLQTAIKIKEFCSQIKLLKFKLSDYLIFFLFVFRLII